MSEDQFVEKVRRELRTLVRRESDLATKYENVQRERAAVRTRTAELTRLLDQYQRFMGLTPVEGEAPIPVSPGETRADGLTHPSPANVASNTPAMLSANGNGTAILPTTAEIAAEYMAAHGGRAKITDLLVELIAMGKLKGNEGEYGSVFGALKRHPHRFVKVGPGEFALVGPSEGSEALDS